MQTIIALAEDLLTQWMDQLIELQLKDNAFKGLDGGILCPGCSRIHGRSLDAIYPFMYRAQESGDERYIDAARSLFRWSSKVSFSNGAWENDVAISRWRGITVFGTISLAEALKFHGDLLTPEEKKIWFNRLEQAANFLFENIHIDTSVINYPITAIYAFALAGELLSAPRFTKKAFELRSQCLAYFTEGNRFIFGEGHQKRTPSPKGCYPIDIGYNVEESLPALTLYGLMVNDLEILERVITTIKVHLDFMLPDGAWDNSWGSRCYKWTYWGSRTTDGSLPVLGLLSRIEPELFEPALRNLRLLSRYTKNGLLSGHHPEAGIEPCIHHTISHSKGLALFLNYQKEEWNEPPPAILFNSISDNNKLNRNLTSDAASSNLKIVNLDERPDGVVFYPENQTYIIHRAAWRSTITGYDQSFDDNKINSGNGMTLLWHKLTGPLITASLRNYMLIEPHNMQVPFEVEDRPLTPRIECYHNDTIYSTINDYAASINHIQDKESFNFKIQSRLLDALCNGPTGYDLYGLIEYLFTENAVQIIFSNNTTIDMRSFKLVLPIISAQSESYSIQDPSEITIHKKKCSVTVSTNGKIQLSDIGSNRFFNFVPGFEAIEIQIIPTNTTDKLITTIKCNG